MILLGFCLLLLLQLPQVFGSDNFCIHGGTRYRHGEYFPQNGTVIKTDSPGQCVQCRCHEGYVICEIENCPTLDCVSPVQKPQFCCKHCPGPRFMQEEHSDFVFSEGKPGRKRKKEVCVSGGKQYKNEATWQPVMGPFGVMSCVQCRCQKGKVVCKRLKCSHLPCSQPRRNLGECCPVCPAPEASTPGQTSCLPASSEIFVYRTPKVSNKSEIIQYGFMDPWAQSQDMEVHTWDTRQQSRNLLHATVMPRTELKQLQLRLLGATSYRQLKRYSDRERRLQAKCTSRCAQRILKLETKLRVYVTVLRTRCNEDEMSPYKF